MCAQMEVLKKIRKAGKMNGFATELAEAQAEDFMSFRREFKDFASSVKEWQIKQDAQMDLVVKYINSPADQERKDGIFWVQLKTVLKTTAGKIIVLLLLGSIALAGQRILELIGMIK